MCDAYLTRDIYAEDIERAVMCSMSAHGAKRTVRRLTRAVITEEKTFNFLPLP